MKGKLTVYTILKWLISIFFTAVVIMVIIFPFPARMLHIMAVCEQGEIELGTYCEMWEDDVRITCYIPQGCERLKNIHIVPDWKSVYLKEFDNAEFLGFVEEISAGQTGIQEGWILLTGVQEQESVWYLHDGIKEILNPLSRSMLEERIVVIGYALAVYLLLMCVCIAKEMESTKKIMFRRGIVYELGRFVKDIGKYRRYINYAAKMDLKAEVANSYLNRLWWLLEPFFNMIVYVIVFGNVLGGNINNYGCYIFSALLMWNYFARVVEQSVSLIRANRNIISYVYLPKYVLVLTTMTLNFYKLLFSHTVLFVMLLIAGVEFSINMLWAVPAYVVLLLFCFGLGMLIMHFGVYIDDLRYAVVILLQILMFLSGVFYNIRDTLTLHLGGVVLYANPAGTLIDTLKNALMTNSVRNIPMLFMWLCIGISLIFCGIITIYKNENTYVKVI